MAELDIVRDINTHKDGLKASSEYEKAGRIEETMR